MKIAIAVIGLGSAALIVWQMIVGDVAWKIGDMAKHDHAQRVIDVLMCIVLASVAAAMVLEYFGGWMKRDARRGFDMIEKDKK